MYEVKLIPDTNPPKKFVLFNLRVIRTIDLPVGSFDVVGGCKQLANLPPFNFSVIFLLSETEIQSPASFCNKIRNGTQFSF